MWFPEDFWLAEKCKRRCCQLESTRPAKQWNANLSIFAKLCYIATSDKRQRKRHMSVAQIIPALGKPFSCVHAFVFFILIASGWVGDENAGGRVNSGETDGQNLPADGQEHGRQALPWRVHWGLAIVFSSPSSSIPTLVSNWVTEWLMIINMSDRPMSGHYLTFLMKPLESSEQISSHFRISTLFSLAVRMLPRCFLSVRKLEVIWPEVECFT